MKNPTTQVILNIYEGVVQIQEHERELGKRLEQYQNKCLALEFTVDRLKAVNGEWERDMVGTLHTMRTIDAENAGLRAANVRIVEENRQLATQLSVAQCASRSLKAENTTLKQDLEDLIEQRLDLQNKLKDMEAYQRSLKSQIRALEYELDTYKGI